MRFSINYLTSYGFGAFTEEMGEHLKVSEMFNGVLYLMLLSRRHTALLWSDVARCWRTNTCFSINYTSIGFGALFEGHLKVSDFRR
jgi:hypothetical protein